MASGDEEVTVKADPIERAELEIEARRRGTTIENVATERFGSALEEVIQRVKAAFCGPQSPSATHKRH